jgi:Uma2 family endonuclease
MAEPVRPLNLPDRDGARSWPVQGEWTYEDYCQLPDDGQRYEVIRGYLYVSPAPSTLHQRTVQRLSRALDRIASDQQLGEVFTAPLDVVLPRGIATPVQPDLMFFRRGNLPPADAPSFQGVPDLVIEVLSPSTRRLDLRVKLAAYRDAGVPEVWLADPQARTLAVHGLGEDGKRYLEISRGGDGEAVVSRVLPNLRVEVSEIFAPPLE